MRQDHEQEGRSDQRRSIPGISLLSVAMAFWQLHLYKHPELADTEES